VRPSAIKALDTATWQLPILPNAPQYWGAGNRSQTDGDCAALDGGAWPAWVPVGVAHGHQARFPARHGAGDDKGGLIADDDGTKYWQMFPEVEINFIGRLEDDLYTISAAYHQEDGSSHMLTFDFPMAAYKKFVAELPGEQRETVRQALSRRPYKVKFKAGEAPVMTIVSEIGRQDLRQPK
jgi:hypothetical protein